MRLTLISLIAIFGVAGYATAESIINFSPPNFFADPTVSIIGDGTTAIISEDPALESVLLSNDPGLGDDVVISSGPINSLFFTYNFVEGTGSDDSFSAFILDSSGNSAGTGFEFFATEPSSGTVSFDLVPLTGEKPIGIQFQLNSEDEVDFSSTVTIDTLTFIPEPSTYLMFFFISFVLFLIKRNGSANSLHSS